jgi:YihY family inner membrane protein
LGALIRHLTLGVDRFQRRFRVTGVAFAVVKRYGEDHGGQLAGLVTFYGFLSVFPLLLLLLTFAGIFLEGTKLQEDIINSALAQFPVIGDQLASNIHAIARGNPFAITVSVIGLIWGSLGVTSSMQLAAHRIWRRPREEEPGIWPRTLKGIEILSTVLLIVVVSSVAAALSTIGVQYFGGSSIWPRVIIFVAALGVNFLGYVLILWLLAPPDRTLRLVLPGAIAGAIGWTILQAISGYLLGHQFHHASQIYGFFAVVLGMIFWISLGVQLFLYATELNVVIARREWPRYLFGDPEAESGVHDSPPAH